MRQAMVHGQTVSACELCYQEEALNGFSHRTIMNQAWKDGWLNAKEETIEGLKAQAAARGYRAELPNSLGMIVGNPCNLKCRMCDGFNSSRIERDAVHAQWRGDPAGDPTYIPSTSLEHWSRRQDVIQDLLRQPERLEWISLSGGETLLIKEVGEILQYLVDQGVAHRIILELHSNATFIHARWLDLIPRFKMTRLVFSIDGHGRYYEYIRYPARWDRVAGNMMQLRQRLPGAMIDTSITVQNYNMLHLTELLRYLDGVDQDFSLNILDGPEFLRARAMPCNVRRRAAELLREYSERDCRPHLRDQVLGVAEGLRSVEDPVNFEVLHEFMLFTNDLDVTRGQSFRDTHADLVDLLAEAGFEWTSATRYAPDPHEDEAVALPPDTEKPSLLSLPVLRGRLPVEQT